MPQRRNASHDGKTTRRRDDGSSSSSKFESRSLHKHKRIGKSFFFLIYILSIVFRFYLRREGTGRATMTKSFSKLNNLTYSDTRKRRPQHPTTGANETGTTARVSPSLARNTRRSGIGRGQEMGRVRDSRRRCVESLVCFFFFSSFTALLTFIY
jgi:hypothetical protein